MFQGIYTALATPMTPSGAVDYTALGQLLEAQIRAAVQGVVLLGTTAETPTLSAAEKAEILAFCTARCTGKLKVIIGTGSNSTVSAVEAARAVQPFQPDGILVVTPYYNKPNPSGLAAHFAQVAAVGLPVILYHIPGRTGLKLSAEGIEHLLAQVPQIAGIKEADYDLARVAKTAVKQARKISYLCGNDDLFPAYLALGASGIISAAANVLAPAFVKIYQLFKQGKPEESFAVFSQIYPLVELCYAETNPTCIKYMLSKLGFGTDTVRLPLGEISSAHKSQIDAVLAQTEAQFLIQG